MFKRVNNKIIESSEVALEDGNMNPKIFSWIVHTDAKAGKHRNSGSGGIWAGTSSGRIGRYQTGSAFFFMLYY